MTKRMNLPLAILFINYFTLYSRACKLVHDVSGVQPVWSQTCTEAAYPFMSLIVFQNHYVDVQVVTKPPPILISNYIIDACQ